MDQELNSGEDSKQNLLEARRKLIAESATLKKSLEERDEEIDILKSAAAAAQQQSSNLREAAKLEYEMIRSAN